MRKAVREIDEYWNDLLFAIAEGKQSDIKELNRLDLFEFYNVFKAWQDDIERKKSDWEKRKAKLKAKR